MDWEPSPVDASYTHSHTYETQKAMWDEERSGEREISTYWRDTQLPYDCRVYKERLKKGIPLTEYQQRVVDAGGWPYDKEPPAEPLEDSVHEPETEFRPARAAKAAPPSDPYPSEEELAKTAKKQNLIKHCKKYRDLPQHVNNQPHIDRWNEAIRLISKEDYIGLSLFAKPFANRGWTPWQDLLKEIN